MFNALCASEMTLQYDGRIYLSFQFWPNTHCCPGSSRKNCRALWSSFVDRVSGFFNGPKEYPEELENYDNLKCCWEHELFFLFTVDIT